MIYLVCTVAFFLAPDRMSLRKRLFRWTLVMRWLKPKTLSWIPWLGELTSVPVENRVRYKSIGKFRVLEIHFDNLLGILLNHSWNVRNMSWICALLHSPLHYSKETWIRSFFAMWWCFLKLVLLLCSFNSWCLCCGRHLPVQYHNVIHHRYRVAHGRSWGLWIHLHHWC